MKQQLPCVVKPNLIFNFKLNDFLIQDKEDRDEREKRGMISNHSYVITAVEEIPYKSGTTKLIRVRNPWGDTEWNGAWCDGYVTAMSSFLPH